MGQYIGAEHTSESADGERDLESVSAAASAVSLALAVPGLLLVELLSRLLSLMVPGNDRPFKKL